MNLSAVKAFEAELARHVPGFRVMYKDESALMQLIGTLVRPFNKQFMTSFTTTLGKTVYFPSRAHYEEIPARTLTTLAHEFVHVTDDEKHGLWFKASYLFPQVLFAPSLLLGLLGLFLTSWSWGLVLLSLVALTPLSAPWRAKWEARGYTMSLAVTQWLTGAMTSEYREHIAKHFYGPNYYFMVGSKENARQLVDECAAYAASPRILSDGPYAIVHSFLDKHGLARRG